MNEYILAYAHTHTYIHTCTYIHTYTHTYTHTYILNMRIHNIDNTDNSCLLAIVALHGLTGGFSISYNCDTSAISPAL